MAHRKSSCPQAAALTIAAVAAAAMSGALLAKKRFDAHPVMTMGGPALVYSPTKDVRVLKAGGVFQSATYLDERCFVPVFEYYRCFDTMFAAETPLASAFGHGMTEVLMLGGGGFSYPKHVLTSRLGLALDVVEIDPSVVACARRWFFLDRLERRLASPGDLPGNRMRVFVADAREFIELPDRLFTLSCPRAEAGRKGVPLHRHLDEPVEKAQPYAQYNAIVNDCFSGREPVRALATLEAAHAIRRRLVPGGLYLSNVVSCNEGTDLSFLRDVVATLKRVFLHVHVVPCTDERFGGEDNYLVIATDSESSFKDAVPYDASFLGCPLTDASIEASGRRG